MSTALKKVTAQMKKNGGEESKAALATEALSLHMRAAKVIAEETFGEKMENKDIITVYDCLLREEILVNAVEAMKVRPIAGLGGATVSEQLAGVLGGRKLN